MKIVENAISLIAPHRCLICKIEGQLLCSACRIASLGLVPSRCYRCHMATSQYAVCKSCKSSVKINHVWVASHYENAAKELLHRFKFERAKAASGVVAELIDEVVPNIPKNVIICHIPTANNRVRMRGYDQAEEIAKNLAGLRGWQREKLLIRLGSSRQVGSSRKERFEHIEKALKLKGKTVIKGRHVLLVDDVTTTGATIEAAAKILKKAGAKTVDVAVFAQPI